MGYIAPDGRAALNVAIRTVVLDGAHGELGIGSGITAGSDPAAEYEECLLKAEFLTRPLPDFALIETLRWEHERGYALLSRHMTRLADSACYFGFPYDEARVRAELERGVAECAGKEYAQRVRLLLERAGEVTCACTQIEPAASSAPLPRAALHAVRVDSADRFLCHKTTHRELYDAARREAGARGLLDFFFQNERGELTEGAITNLFVEKDGALWTPPVACGLLPGTLRGELLATGNARERVLYVHDLDAAEAVFAGNSVMGLVRVEIVGT
jgi:para-aminobenzoate synthetase/4-amino-4-deoxychorismate lyase